MVARARRGVARRAPFAVSLLPWPADEEANYLLRVVPAAVLWILAVAIHVPSATHRARPWIALSVAIHSVAFILPAASREGTDYLGYEAYIQALVFVMNAWMANPAYLVAVFLARHGVFETSWWLATLALILGVTVRFSHPGVDVWIGHYAWLGSFVVLALGSAMGLVHQRRERPEQASDPERPRAQPTSDATRAAASGWDP